jgi:hypothetical protein
LSDMKPTLASVSQLESEAIRLIEAESRGSGHLDYDSTAWSALRWRLLETCLAAESCGLAPRMVVARGQTPEAWKARERRTPEEKAAKVIYLARRFVLLAILESPSKPIAMDKDLLVGDVHETSRWSQE